VLLEDAACLEARYPGQNATEIAQQQDIVVESWSSLRQRATNHKEELRESCELQRFLTQVIPCLNFLWCRVLTVSVETLKQFSSLFVGVFVCVYVIHHSTQYII